MRAVSEFMFELQIDQSEDVQKNRLANTTNGWKRRDRQQRKRRLVSCEQPGRRLGEKRGVSGAPGWPVSTLARSTAQGSKVSPDTGRRLWNWVSSRFIYLSLGRNNVDLHDQNRGL